MLFESTLSYALFYASFGWAVFPCEASGKAPLIRGGLTNATTDINQIQEWWRKWPNANVAIRTGTGLVVVDVDHATIPQGLDLPDTLSVHTGRGSHYYYSCASSVPNGVNVNIQGVDIRGDGGYVIAPPSIHKNGTMYTWVDEEMRLHTAPEWVTNRGGKSATLKYDKSGVTDRDDPWRPAELGERDARALHLAAVLVKDGQRNKERLVGAILSWNKSNDPPVGELEGDPLDVTIWAEGKAWRALQLAAGNAGEAIDPVSGRALKGLQVDREWVVGGGVLTERSKTIIYGPTGVGKTFMGLQLAHCISTGTTWLGQFPITRPYRVLYISGENPIDDLKGRLVTGSRGITSYCDAVDLYSTFQLNLRDPASISVLQRAIHDGGYEVVFLDPLYIFARVDETKLLDVVGVEIAINQLIADENVSFVILHHPTKDKYERGKKYDTGINALRGAGWAMWAEGVLELDMRDPHTSTRVLTFQKVRSAASGKEIELTFDHNQLFHQIAGSPGDILIMAYIVDNGPVSTADVQVALKDKPGCANVRRSVSTLLIEGKVRYHDSTHLLVAG